MMQYEWKIAGRGTDQYVAAFKRIYHVFGWRVPGLWRYVKSEILHDQLAVYGSQTNAIEAVKKAIEEDIKFRGHHLVRVRTGTYP